MKNLLMYFVIVQCYRKKKRGNGQNKERFDEKKEAKE